MRDDLDAIGAAFDLLCAVVAVVAVALAFGLVAVAVGLVWP